MQLVVCKEKRENFRQGFDCYISHYFPQGDWGDMVLLISIERLVYTKYT